MALEKFSYSSNVFYPCYGKAAASCTGDSGLESCVREAEAEWRIGAQLAQDKCSYSSNDLPLSGKAAALHWGLWLWSLCAWAEAERRLGAQMAQDKCSYSSNDYPCWEGCCVALGTLFGELCALGRGGVEAWSPVGSGQA